MARDTKLTRDSQYDLCGDGFMPHRCSVLKDTKAYLAKGADHMRLPLAPDVIQAVIDLLNDRVPTTIPEYHPGELPCPEPV